MNTNFHHGRNYNGRHPRFTSSISQQGNNPNSTGAFQIFAGMRMRFTFRREKPTGMTKEEFVSMAAQRYEELQALNKLNNFYDYEKQFVDIRKGLGREVLQKNLGSMPAGKRNKKMMTIYSNIRIHIWF